MVKEPDGTEVTVPASSVEATDNGMARVKMPDGSYMTVPKYEVIDEKPSPFRPWTTWLRGMKIPTGWAARGPNA